MGDELGTAQAAASRAMERAETDERRMVRVMGRRDCRCIVCWVLVLAVGWLDG